MAQNNIKRTNPNAAVFIYNYRDRMGDSPAARDITNQFEIDQIILNTTSLLSITTNKDKSKPSGTFEIRLAPTKNWVTAITPGSWCVILMSNSAINDTAKYTGGTVDEKSFKMIGRIESVRGAVEVDQTTGARNSGYIVQGVDWATIFDSILYVDPLNRAGNESALGMAMRFGYDKHIKAATSYESGKFGPNAKGESPSKTRQDLKTDGSNKKLSPNKSTLNLLDKGLNAAAAEDGVPTNNAAIEAQGPQTLADIDRTKLPSAANSVEFLLSLWGETDDATSAAGKEANILSKSLQQFRLPDELAKYMQFKIPKTNKVSGVISDILHPIVGKLIGKDEYSGVDQSAGIIDFRTILGEHTMWQLLNSNCNSPINELIPEIRFENGSPKMALYQRVRPFAVKTDSEILADNREVGDNQGALPAGFTAGPTQKSQVSEDKELAKFFLSRFQNVRTKTIDLNDVVTCNFGTNWRDKYNFIEVNIDRSIFQESFSNAIKLESQFKDADSIGRDGLKSMIASFAYVPVGNDGFQSALNTFVYKYALKEWYFNTHKMLNGSLQLIGQDQYIQVGDNIRVKAEALGVSKNISAAQKKSRKFTYMTAHVESVSHTVKVSADGARTFMTSIDFVRGIITDIDGNLIAQQGNAGAVDQDAEKMTPVDEKNKGTVGTSGPKDPDRQKLRGE